MVLSPVSSSASKIVVMIRQKAEGSKAEGRRLQGRRYKAVPMKKFFYHQVCKYLGIA